MVTRRKFDQAVVLGCLVIASTACSARTDGRTATEPSSGTGFVRRVGRTLVAEDGRPLILRGISFGNEVWRVETPSSLHHDEDDFARVASMGMNVVRFYLSYHFFESDSAPGDYHQRGWDWLDRNVLWAKRHGVRLILNMHVPPGGFQSTGAGASLWDSEEPQDRLVSLWTAIAARYRDEPAVAGYDLLNEPVVTRSKAQWVKLAERLVRAIRSVDPNHVIIVERVAALGFDAWTTTPEESMFIVPDENVVYTFHVYTPFAFTHQLLPSVTTPIMGRSIAYPEGGRYPDGARIDDPPQPVWLGIATFDAPVLPPGTTGWARFQGPLLTAEDPRITFSTPVLVGRGLGSGTAYFDDCAAPAGSRLPDPPGNGGRGVA